MDEIEIKGSMNADLERLVALQKLDIRIAEKSGLLRTFPEEIKEAYASCEKAKSALAAFDAGMETDRKKRKDLEREVEDIKEKMAKARAKLPQVKTNVEYRAILKEQEGFEAKISELDDMQLELMEKMENLAPQRKALDSDLKREEEKFAAVKKEKEAAMDEVKKEYEALKSERESTLSLIAPPILANYERVLRMRDGVGVARVKDNICQGCNQLIPPQLYYLIRTSDDIHRCPHCSRFLYFEAQQAEEAEKEAT